MQHKLLCFFFFYHHNTLIAFITKWIRFFQLHMFVPPVFSSTSVSLWESMFPFQETWKCLITNEKKKHKSNFMVPEQTAGLYVHTLSGLPTHEYMTLKQVKLKACFKSPHIYWLYISYLPPTQACCPCIRGKVLSLLIRWQSRCNLCGKPWGLHLRSRTYVLLNKSWLCGAFDGKSDVSSGVMAL